MQRRYTTRWWIGGGRVGVHRGGFGGHGSHRGLHQAGAKDGRKQAQSGFEDQPEREYRQLVAEIPIGALLGAEPELPIPVDGSLTCGGGSGLVHHGLFRLGRRGMVG